MYLKHYLIDFSIDMYYAYFIQILIDNSLIILYQDFLNFDHENFPFLKSFLKSY